MQHNYPRDPTDERFILVNGVRHEIEDDGYVFRARNTHGHMLTEFQQAQLAYHTDGSVAFRLQFTPVEEDDTNEWFIRHADGSGSQVGTFDLYQTNWYLKESLL